MCATDKDAARKVYKAEWYQKNKVRIYEAAKVRYQQDEALAAARKKYKDEWYQKNKVRILAETLAKYPQNRERKLATNAARYVRKRDALVAYSKAYYHGLTDEQKRIAFDKANARNRLECNQTKNRTKTSLRRKRHQLSTPKWLTKTQRAEMRSTYAKAIELTEATGVAHQVDHIVPLRGTSVCGLHVPWNLQILTATENSRKGNKFSSDQLHLGD